MDIVIGLWETREVIEEAFPLVEFDNVYQVDNDLYVSLVGREAPIVMGIPNMGWWEGFPERGHAVLSFYITLLGRITEDTKVNHVPLHELVQYPRKLLTGG